jgi:hypothetical protein
MYVRPAVRQQIILPLFALLLLAVLLAACGGEEAAGPPDAKDLLRRSQAAMLKIKSYHFNLVAENPGATGNMVVKTADGDTLVPDKLKAKASVLILGNAAEVQMVAIGEKQYVTDPITGSWITTKDLIDPRALSNSQTGIAALLGNIQEPSAPVDSNVDGTPCWSVDGKLDAKFLAGIVGGNVAQGTTVAVTTCIGKSDNLPYLIKMNGKVVQSDSDKTVRTFKLSKFDQSVTIEAPI